jgi:hemoglobin-like flavoprotein
MGCSDSKEEQVKKELPFPKVQATWKKALAVAEAGGSSFGEKFYANLFKATTPSLKDTLFGRTHHAEQRMNLTRSITLVLNMLDDMPKAAAALESLGARHVMYIGPVGPETAGAYDLVGTVLVQTLTQLAGEADIKDAAEEWKAVYGVVKDTMIKASLDEKQSLPWLKKFNAKRIAEFKSLLARTAGPDGFAPTDFAKRLVGSANGGKPVAADNAVVVAVATLFDSAVNDAAAQQLLTPFVAAATVVATAVKAENASAPDAAKAVLDKLKAGLSQLLENEVNPLSHYDVMVLGMFQEALSAGFAKK